MQRITITHATRALLVLVLTFAATAGAAFVYVPRAAAETAAELQQKIIDGQKQIDAIDAEIKKYQSQLNEVGAQKQTLQKAINELDLSRKKLAAQVASTQQQISSTDLEIGELDREIQVKEIEIGKNVDAVTRAFQTIDQTEGDTMVEMLLAHDSLADVWNTVEEQTNLQSALREQIKALGALKSEYENAKDRSEQKRTDLAGLQTQLTGQKDSLDQTATQKSQLLSQTKSKESNYQQLLAEKKAARDQFEQEISAYEAKLKFILDPSTIPAAGSGVLRWPFEPAYMLDCPNYIGALGNNFCITQYFGDTEFSRTAAYNGKGHNGVDFRAPIGTAIDAALGGVVQATNEGVAPNCQYGKWVLIKHGNGLTTLYAHLSSIIVSTGQSVSTGQTIGYSGATGYVTGPHLHLSLFVSAAVSFKDYTCNSGPTVKIPVAAYSGYLNPLDYL